jgi:hypothetical protein
MRCKPLLFALALPLLYCGVAYAQCTEEPPLFNYTGAGQVVCPCFIAGEQAAVVLDAPPAHYPLEITRIGIGWGSVFNGNPAQIEQAIHVYAGTIPSPGAPVFTLPGPQLTDGFINVYNIEPLPGEVNVTSGPFMVALEFLNDSAGNSFASSVVHDGNGCQGGENAVLVQPGGWFDACVLGVTGDWVMYVVYKPCTVTGIAGTFVSASSPAFITRTTPNPFTATTDVEFVLDRAGRARVDVYDVGGRVVARLADADYTEGVQSVAWDGRDTGGRQVPSGVYFVKLSANGVESARKVLLSK